jgi:hypothetical protein
MLADRLKALNAEKSLVLEDRQQAVMTLQQSANIEDISEKMVAFADNFREVFDAAPIYDKRRLINKCLRQIIVDSKQGKVRVFLRKFPHINSDVEKLLTEGEEKEMAPFLRVPFRSATVPGTGLEPAQPFGHRLLRPACLPISPPGHFGTKDN